MKVEVIRFVHFTPLCTLQFSILSLWDDYRVSVYPVIVPWLVPLMHIAVMSSVYCTILIR